MTILKAFRALRAQAKLAASICTLPYDVMSTEEAREMAEGNPLSFLRVTRAELELPPDADPYSDAVYQRGAENLKRLISEKALVRDPVPCYTLYRQIMKGRSQVGLGAIASCAEYDADVIRKHEKTRADKEEDRVRHIRILGAQTGPVFLFHKNDARISAKWNQLMKAVPDMDFVAEDGIQHTAWIISDPVTIGEIESLFADIPILYVADGHHRSAAAARLAREQREKNPGATGEELWNFFLSVTFPADQLNILGYNRLVRDLSGMSPQQFLERLLEIGDLVQVPEDHEPRGRGETTLYVDGQWHLLRWKASSIPDSPNPADRLDVAILQAMVLDPMLGIKDPRTDKRISFVGGIRGIGELEKAVKSGSYAAAFVMHPPSTDDIVAIANAGGIMPPKSTWFEPKLRDAVMVHLI